MTPENRPSTASRASRSDPVGDLLVRCMEQLAGGDHGAIEELCRAHPEHSQEIRERMYDNPPGSPWWSACKTELEARNSEQTAAALVDMSRILDKMRISAERLDSLSDRVLQATAEATELLRVTSESGRRLEIAAYVMVGVTVVQLFYAAFLVLGRR